MFTVGLHNNISFYFPNLSSKFSTNCVLKQHHHHTHSYISPQLPLSLHVSLDSFLSPPLNSFVHSSSSLSLSCYSGPQWDSGQRRGGEENLIPAPPLSRHVVGDRFKGRKVTGGGGGVATVEKKTLSGPHLLSSLPCQFGSGSDTNMGDGNDASWGVINRYCILMEIK